MRLLLAILCLAGAVRASPAASRKVGEQNKLFGSVTSKDVHEQLAAQGYEIERRQVHLAEPLKEVGTHEVEVKLHPEVSAKIKVTIAAEA